MSEPLYRRVVPIPERLAMWFPDYREIETVVEDVRESFYRDYLRGAIRVTLIPRSMEIPCEILVAITPRYDSLEKVAAFADRLAENEQFLTDSLEGAIVEKRDWVSRREVEQIDDEGYVKASA